MAVHRAGAYSLFHGLHTVKQRIGLSSPGARVPDGKLAVRNDPPLNRPEIWHSIILANLT
jgi:hypothetical protein